MRGCLSSLIHTITKARYLCHVYLCAYRIYHLYDDLHVFLCDRHDDHDHDDMGDMAGNHACGVHQNYQACRNLLFVINMNYKTYCDKKEKNVT